MSIGFIDNKSSDRQNIIKKLLLERGVESNDIDMWIRLMSNLTDSKCDQLMVAIQDDVTFRFLNNNLKEKIQAFTANDQDAISRILKNEESFVSSIRE